MLQCGDDLCRSVIADGEQFLLERFLIGLTALILSLDDSVGVEYQDISGSKADEILQAMEAIRAGAELVAGEDRLIEVERDELPAANQQGQGMAGIGEHQVAILTIQAQHRFFLYRTT